MTGLTRNAVYKASKRVLQRLMELGAPYREEGRLARADQAGDGAASAGRRRAIADARHPKDDESETGTGHE